MNNKLISFIGGGKMAQAIVSGLLKNKVFLPENILISDPNNYQHDYFHSLNIKTTNCNVEATTGRDVIIFAIKPQVFPAVIKQIKQVPLKNTLVYSILAGIEAQSLLNNLDIDRCIRVMPNTPCVIGQGVSVWYPVNCDQQQLDNTRDILTAIGSEIQVDDESYIDMATALSGTGPAYLFLLAESMIDAGVHMGLSREKARIMVEDTLQGSISYLRKVDKHTALLRNEITSPGGTTAAALYSFEKNGFRSNVYDAILAAYKRSIELKDIDSKSDK